MKNNELTANQFRDELLRFSRGNQVGYLVRETRAGWKDKVFVIGLSEKHTFFKDGLNRRLLGTRLTKEAKVLWESESKLALGIEERKVTIPTKAFKSASVMQGKKRRTRFMQSLLASNA